MKARRVVTDDDDGFAEFNIGVAATVAVVVVGNGDEKQFGVVVKDAMVYVYSALFRRILILLIDIHLERDLFFKAPSVCIQDECGIMTAYMTLSVYCERIK